MITRLGTVPAILCVVAAALLGGWGWGARDASSDRARDEAARREAFEVSDGDLFGGVERSDPVELTCAALIDAALLQPPTDPTTYFGGEGSVTTLLSSTIDGAWMLVGILTPEMVAGLPGLDHPDLRDAIVGLRSALQAALARTAEPFADPDVIAAAAGLRGALIGRCL